MAKVKASFIAWRFNLILIFILLLVLSLAARTFYLSILDRNFLRHEGDERSLRLVSTPGFRGMILDRNNFPLAVSTKVYSVWINPKDFAADKKELIILAKVLSLKPSAILALSTIKKRREFTYLKRSLSPEIARQIKQMNIPGLYLQPEYRRFYPEGEVTAHIVGFTNVDDKGQEGMELAYNEWLQGMEGKQWMIKDRLGRSINDVQTVQAQKAGNDLVLSIDKRIQYLAYRELLAGVTQNQASSGSAIVLDTKTGEILAMVNQPSYNPNNRANQQVGNFRNRAITDTFEPGSTIKAFTVASGLESGLYQPDSVINTSPGWMRVGHDVVKDEKNNGELNLARILQISSNMGAAKMILSMPPNQLWNLLHRLGFGEITGIGFPGEQNGMLTKHEPWGGIVLATFSFGYGLSATTLQIARAYAVLANQGVKLPLSLLRLDQPPTGEKVLDPKIATEMLNLLETVVKGGTAREAQVPGYRVAGKTGTSRKVGAKGYEKHHYNASFVGIAPVSDPRLVVVVVINDPLGKQYLGGKVAAPVFEKIMEGTLRILNVAPDA